MQKRYFDNSSRSRCKKAFVDVDWAMSLGIFLLYIAWFFFFLSTNTQTLSQMDTLMHIVNTGVQDTYYWNVYKTPLFVYSNIETKNEPLIIDFPFNYNLSDFTIIPPVDFDLVDNQLHMVSDIKYGTNLFYIVTSSDSYDNHQITHDLNQESSFVTTRNNTYRIYYTRSLPESIYANDEFIVSDIKYYFNDFEFVNNLTKNESYNKSQVAAWYENENDYFTIKSMMFGGATQAIFFVDPKVSQEYVNVTMSMEIPLDYYRYFGNNIFFGDVDLYSSKCYSNEWNYLDLYSNTRGITFNFNQTVKFDFCPSNLSINLNITFPIDELKFSFISHDGDFRTTLNYTEPITNRYGLKEVVSGVDISKVLKYNQTGYRDIKTLWGYPDEKNFNLIIQYTNETTISSIEYEKPKITDNVYVKDIYDHVLHKNSTLEKIKVLVQIW